MSIRQRIAKWIVSNAWDSSQVKYGSPAWTTLFGAPSKVPALTESSALTVSSIYACVSLLAGAISGLPLNIYKVDRKGFREEIWGDDLWWTLNEQMSDRWSAANGWEFMTLSLLLHGNAYARIMRDASGRVVGLRPIHPVRVEVYLNGEFDRLVYAVSHDPNDNWTASRSPRMVLDQDDIVHVAGLGFDGLKGLSPLQYALRMTGGVSLATQDFSANFFANSARPDYALTADKPLTADQVSELRNQIAERHQGTENSHKPMVLHSGMDIKSISMPIEDLQLVALRQFQVEEIARVFGVPPFMIGHNEKTTSWGSGVEAMGIGFVRYTLRPYLNKFENEFNRKLITNSPKMLAFDTEDLERADMKSLYEGLRSGVGRAGEKQLVAVNEARKKLRLKPVKGGDEITTNPDHASPSGADQKDENDAQLEAA